LPYLASESLERRALAFIALTGLILGLVAMAYASATTAHWLWTIATLPVVLRLAISIVRDLVAGRMGVDAVALVAMTAAILLNESLAAVVIAVMYSGGNLLEDIAVGRAERDLKSLVDRAPRIAHRRIGSTYEDISIEQVAIGDVLLVRAGEVIPVDGIVSTGNAMIDESALTGEPIPIARPKGDAVRSGTVNVGETFELSATASAGESTYAGIIRLVTAAQRSKAPFIRIADRFALLLLPATLLLSGAAWLFSGDPIRGLAVLVTSTPCPLILAAPVALIAGVSRAARRGVLIKGGAALEALASTRTVMFDKTGTLTIGGARLVAIETSPGYSANEVLRVAASLEQASQNVVAEAIVSAAIARGLKLVPPQNIKERMGSGLTGQIEDRTITVGSFELVSGLRHPEPWEQRILRRASWRSALSVFVSIDGDVAGAILLADELRRETPRAIESLRENGAERVVMVTGDRADSAETIAAALDLDAVLSERTPADKVEAVAIESRLAPTIMIGDGINDAPALAAASVGIAMGARGANASSEAADAVILIDRVDRVSEAVAIARRAYAIALQSIAAGMAMSFVAMIAAAFGYLTPVAGAVTQEVIDVAVILNALRALGPPWGAPRKHLHTEASRALLQNHEDLTPVLDRLREIADELDEAEPLRAVALIAEADTIVKKNVAEHEKHDESTVYPELAKILRSRLGLAAMSRAHREILHLSRLLARLADGLEPAAADHYLIRDAQRVIEAIEALVRIHNAQEEDIYETISA
jgi:heavy metal translocating P-type ATPase